jgi:endonuclease G
MELPEADETHTVPTGYFKVVATTAGAVTAFVFDQDEASDHDYCGAIESLDDVEDLTGLDLFPRAADWPTGDLDSRLGCE